VTLPDTIAPRGASYAELLDTFERLTPSEIAVKVERLAAAVRARRYPAGRPYRHVNGFTKIVAAEYACGARLTLHYWPAEFGAAPDVSRPHDHRFPFTSILLTGAQHFLELDESVDDSQPWNRYVYRPHVGGRVASVAGRGATRLRVFRTVERQPFRGHYATTSTVVHQAVTQRDAACATLVLRGPRERRASNVYYAPGEPPPRGGLQFGRWLGHDVVLHQIGHVLKKVSEQ
jgi:hypothetical protein